MATDTVIGAPFSTAMRLVALLEQGGFRLDAAVWAADEDGGWRLFLVPRDREQDELNQMIRVAHTISRHRDELPDRHALRYAVVGPDHPVIRAVRPYIEPGDALPQEIDGAYGNGSYLEKAVVLRFAG